MDRSAWIREIPEIGRAYVERADAIATAKANLRAQLEATLRAEADLWSEIVKTDQWPRKDTFAALLKMDAELVRCLPSKI